MVERKFATSIPIKIRLTQSRVPWEEQSTDVGKLRNVDDTALTTLPVNFEFVNLDHAAFSLVPSEPARAT